MTNQIIHHMLQMLEQPTLVVEVEEEVVDLLLILLEMLF